MRRIIRIKSSIHTSQPADLPNMTRLIRSLIGRDVPTPSSWLEDEDVSKFTTIHQAVAMKNITQPIKTEKREIA